MAAHTHRRDGHKNLPLVNTQQISTIEIECDCICRWQSVPKGHKHTEETKLRRDGGVLEFVVPFFCVKACACVPVSMRVIVFVTPRVSVGL